MRKLFLACIAVAMIACGSNKNGSGTDGGGNGDGANGDGANGDGLGGMCTAGAAQCNNCIDDDSDGKIDGFDPECTGPADNDESTFATGIPGDNMDAINQDCFFDGDSGAGNDGCNQHVCCLLGAKSTQECADDLVGLVNNPQQEGNKYDFHQCFMPLGDQQVPQQCKDVCGPISPPGCDCFGCCTECDAQGCVDIALNPATSPDCDSTTLHDPTKCKPCTKVADCGGGDCGGSTCILCPGQDPSQLPPECNTPTCPTGTMPCDAAGQCPEGTFCSTGCCIGIIQ
jgi:hypothetical protein